MVNIYLKAFFISLGIFLFGLLVGLSIERLVASEIIARTASVEESVQEMELQMLYFQGLNESYACNFLNEIVRRTNNKLDELAGQLLSYSEKGIIFTRDEVEDLKRRYTSLLIKDWILQERIKENCDTRIATVLYFYSTERCDECIIQGNVLTVLKNSFKEKLMVFPLDINIKVSMVNILMDRYNITSVPSLVVSDKAYSGIVSKDEVKSIICEELGNVTACL